MGDKNRGKSRTIYIGMTKDLGRRLMFHISNRGARRTRGQELEIGRLEKYTSRQKAAQREYDLKHDPQFKQKETRKELIREFQSQYNSQLIILNQTITNLFSTIADVNSLTSEITKNIE